jgi:hypothetical protein
MPPLPFLLGMHCERFCCASQVLPRFEHGASVIGDPRPSLGVAPLRRLTGYMHMSTIAR